MKQDTVDKLNKVLNISGELVKKEKNQSPDVEVNTKDLTTEYEFSQEQYHTLLDKGNDALDELLAVAKESENHEITYSKMPPNVSPEELDIEEALNMFNYPLNIKDNIEIRIGPYGWYVTNGMKNISLGQNRNPPSKEEALKALEQKPTSEIIKKISKDWTLRRKKDSYFLMYSKGKKPIFYPVNEHDGEWSVLRCEEIQKKNKRRK